jgi:hypothetical protein
MARCIFGAANNAANRTANSANNLAYVLLARCACWLPGRICWLLLAMRSQQKSMKIATKE